MIGLFYAFGGVACIMFAPFTWFFFAYAGTAVHVGRRFLFRLLALGIFAVPMAVGTLLVVIFSPVGDKSEMVLIAVGAFLGVCPVALIQLIRRRSAIRREVQAEGRELPSPRRRFDRDLLREAGLARAWLTQFAAASKLDIDTRGWLGQRFVERWSANRPSGLEALLSKRGLASALTRLPADVEQIVSEWRLTVPERAKTANEQHLAAQLSASRRFFETIERSPLTEEQARAVLCFDDRVRVIASAGSGKTSTIVAKAAYAVASGLVPSDRILILTFNSATARELQDRISSRFAAAGLPAGSVRAQTFHAFGLGLIGSATGRKPSLARWIDQGREVLVLSEILDDLRKRDSAFARSWDRYRTLYADAGSAEAESNTQDRQPTLSGHVVRSLGERLIADFLWTNGVEFEYEKPYLVDTRDADHGQYRPDFYYPAADLWHEHWALDADGLPPAEFEGYENGVQWKRALHAEHRTQLFETRWGDVGSEGFLEDLGAGLSERGIELDERFDRPSRGRQPPTDGDLLTQVRDFLKAVKSEDLTSDELHSRLAGLGSLGVRQRARMFTALALRMLDEWNGRLVAEGAIDFEDMMTTASQLLESGLASSQFDLVLVDEFQDTSPARARLLQALLRDPSCRLFAVGDDWQAINRFAGADLSVFTDFDEWFGPSSTVLLQRTFRSSQAICDAAGEFVAKNPRQLQKRVRSDEEIVSPAVEARLVADEAQQTEALTRFLDGLQSRMRGRRQQLGVLPRRSVRVLGRYDWLKRLVPQELKRWPDLDVRFSTIHASKGLEADYVVVLGMTSGKHGFPSTQRDDPNLALVRPPQDDFLDGEERRLLYVALTRARRRVVLVAEHGKVSPFVRELVHSGTVALVDLDGAPIELCPRCGHGVVRQRSVGAGTTISCDFRRCDYSVSKARPSTDDSRAASVRSEMARR